MKEKKTFVLSKHASYIDSYIKNKSDFLQMVNEKFGFRVLNFFIFKIIFMTNEKMNLQDTCTKMIAVANLA